MAYDDSPDQEFDQDMERILQDHFDSDPADLRAPQNTWERLESRLDEPPEPFPISRWLSSLIPVRRGRFSPVFAGFAAAVVAAVVVSVALISIGNGEGGSGGGFAVAPATEEPVARSLATTAPAVTTAPQAIVSRAESGPAGPAGEQGAAGSQGPVEPAGARGGGMAPASTTVPPAPAATSAPAMAMEEEENFVAAESAAATVAAAPTAAPAATAVPIPMPTVVPVPTYARTPMPTTALVPAATVAPAPAAAFSPQPTVAAMLGPRCGTPNGPACPPTATPGVLAVKAAIPPASTARGAGSPSDTLFRDYLRQPFVSAADDNVSTFSLDTDNTSYHLALGWARTGYEVDPDSVRAEEWINAFDYRYDQPANDSEFEITSGLFPHPLDDSKRLARIAFQAPELTGDRPLNVTLVLDASGSMADGDRVDIARAAAERHPAKPSLQRPHCRRPFHQRRHRRVHR